MKINLTLKKLRLFIIFITFILISAEVGWQLGSHRIRFQNSNLDGKQAKFKLQNYKIINKNNPTNKKLDFSLFWEVWDKLENKYLEKDKIDEKKMFYGAIQGMTASLGDPYTVFLPPKNNQETKEDLNGSFEGVGIRLGFKDNNRLIVIAPLKGMPAEKVGVKAGDLILHLKDKVKGIDEDTIGMSLPEAVEKIRGPRETTINFTLLHEGEDKPFQVDIIRKTIVVPSVEVDFLDLKNGKGTGAKIAHLKLMRFGELTAEQWDKAVTEIKNQPKPVKGIILDLRGNPGGYLSGAVNLASEFLSQGVVVKQEDYKGGIETYSVNRKGRLLKEPLVVLIDKGSASASEILCGALQDYQRAKLVGVQSFGKGIIQEAEDLSDGAGLHITTAKWLTPKGRWINKKGLTPDIEVKNDPDKPNEDKQLDKAIEILTSIKN